MVARPRDVVARKRNTGRRSKVKTGCKTCRIRKIKCDEIKPSCQRCTTTGRTCDGYESAFKSWEAQSIGSIRVSSGGNKSIALSGIVQPTVGFISQDIELLNRYFSTKTLFNVNMGCLEEARQVLQASLTDPSVRHAVSSLRALRQDLEISGDTPTSVAHPTPGFHYGLQQYNMALGGLASNMSLPSSSTIKSALRCCQIFISIEQVQKNYSAMAQHIIRGLRIMYEYRARPYFIEGSQLVPAYDGHLPLVDVFIIKLFSAPCKFADSPAVREVFPTTSPASFDSPHEGTDESPNVRTILPDMRTRLTVTAELILEFLSKMSQVVSVEDALQLKSEKNAILDSLDSWLNDFELIQMGPEPISMTFLRIFRLILRIILLGALDSSPTTCTELQLENERLQSLANDVGERVQTYITCNGTSSD
ncbi:hypothetical protein ONS95_011480 [Cadophora gregata]|uniref:uncharacterized protein n=1 Tax=Cadophora gregata TaxID=51156 RepID=UPI0026DAB5EE|nr:uncharacterized protein ONS95_011480 [Cadophora gregata]KAK0120067.1 hypothetical protein ONS95_011480 [Cadophora gregata]KAK0121099.1 hypothetical protein ONS96_011281 [Cadophora gregata f. sp. sojae]